jgi:glucose/arabinose dehydrogenase
MAILFLFVFYGSTISLAQPTLTFTPLIQNLKNPVEIKNAGDRSGRLFIAQQSGVINIYKNNSLVKKPFLDIRNNVSLKYLEGLWSVAFSPNYKRDRMFFVLYVSSDKRTVLARYQASETNPDSAIANTGVELLSIPKTKVGPYLGELQFGEDGYLYVSISDGSFFDKLTTFAQNGQLLMGKMLRLKIDVPAPPYYSIPEDNPFIGVPSVREEIWALGLRNAWRWSFDGNSDNMYIADDGNNAWEEVNILKTPKSKGANFGWSCYEANNQFTLSGCRNMRSYSFPSFTYPHDSATGGFAIIGGYVYRGKTYPALKGYYICSDYVSNNAWKIKPNEAGSITAYQQNNIPPLIAGYGEGEDGELYAASLDGTVYSIGATSSSLEFASQSNKITALNTTGSTIYPTLVDNHKIILDLNESYHTLRLFDMAGHEIIAKKLSGYKGKTSIDLPALNAGFYMVQLLGVQTLHQKIYITR